MNWCSICGTVSRVCDFPECDAHERTREIRDRLVDIASELRTKSFGYIRHLTAWKDALLTNPFMVNSLRAKEYLDWSRDVFDMRDLELEYLEVEEKLNHAMFWEDAGVKMVPRSKS